MYLELVPYLVLGFDFDGGFAIDSDFGTAITGDELSRTRGSAAKSWIGGHLCRKESGLGGQAINQFLRGLFSAFVRQ